MDSIKTWLRTHDSVSHIFVALLGFALWYTPLFLFGVANAHWIAAALMVGAYYGRERRDHEVKDGRALSITSFEVSGYFPWNWSRDGQQDFGYPLAAMFALAAFITYLTHFA